jgi:hypothetical protein
MNDDAKYDRRYKHSTSTQRSERNFFTHNCALRFAFALCMQLEFYGPPGKQQIAQAGSKQFTFSNFARVNIREFTGFI